MAKKVLASNLELSGIAPNLLLKQVENTAPFIFQGELNTSSERCAYLEKLRFYKKNLRELKNINLAEYFHICLSAHWATAGTFVPTDVDNQIREGLWKHKSINQYIEKMARITIDSWKWDYGQVTNRKASNPIDGEIISTHEGTWLSVAIGAYCALKKKHFSDLSEEVAHVILEEINKEKDLMLQLREKEEHIAFIKAAPLIAHNFGDLDRVIVQWGMNESDLFCKKIFKLGLMANDPEYSILVYSGEVNKEFTAKENHRHMAMRRPKCLRKSHQFLIPVGPFMDDWGRVLGQSHLLSLAEKAEIVAAFFDGHLRQDQAFGYCRAYGALKRALPGGLADLDKEMPFDLMADIKKSQFSKIANLSREEFEQGYIDRLISFSSKHCPNWPRKA